MPQSLDELMIIKPRPFAWRFALTSSTLAGLTGLVLGAQQLLIKFLHDQAAHTRTVWGLLFMFLAVIGPALPLILIRKRETFARLGWSNQWTAALAIPVIYALVLGLCMLASTYTKRLVMGRPGLRVLVRMDPAHPNQFTTVEMHGLRRELPSRQNRQEDGAKDRFDFVGYQTYLRFPQDVTINANGTARTRDDGNIAISLNFDVTEAFRLQLDGLADAEVTQEGKIVSNRFKFRPGRHQLIATGRPK